MKKNYKRIFALLLVLTQLVLLCGCDALDEMRQNQAFLNEDGDILWNGSTYKKLPACAYLAPLCDYDTIVNVTEEDVPVLLSSMFSQFYYYPSEDGRFLSARSHNTDEVYYCESSVYDAICARIQAPFEPDIVCYSYDVYQEDSYEYETKYYTLTQEQVDAIKLVVQNTTPTTMQDGMYLDSQWSIALEECSQDMVFRRSNMEISYAGSTYYLHLNTDDEQLLFTVPEGCNAIFGEIVKEYLDAESYYYDEELIEDLEI